MKSNLTHGMNECYVWRLCIALPSSHCYCCFLQTIKLSALFSTRSLAIAVNKVPVIRLCLAPAAGNGFGQTMRYYDAFNTIHLYDFWYSKCHVKLWEWLNSNAARLLPVAIPMGRTASWYCLAVDEQWRVFLARRIPRKRKKMFRDVHWLMATAPLKRMPQFRSRAPRSSVKTA